MILLFLLSGLLLGFTLGYQDLYLLLGAGVSKNRKTVWYLVFFAVISLIIGAITNTNGTFLFVGELASVKQIQVAFLILGSALITTILLRFKFKIISVSHAVIGSITGWLLFVDDGLPINKLLAVIIIWLITPILSAILSASYLTLLKSLMRRLHLHILKVGRILQLLLFIALLVAAYSIGANNIANVVGVYSPIFEGANIQVLNLSFGGGDVLVLLGALAISLGLIVRVLRTSSKSELVVFEFSPETNFSVMAAFATVFFLFSSTIFLSAVGYIGVSYPLVPISALHILTAGVVGVSYKKGFNVYQKDSFAGIAIGSILTPVLSGLVMFVAALGLKSIWGNIDTGKIDSINNVESINEQDYLTQFLSINESSIVYNLGVIILLATIVVVGIIIYTRMQKGFNQEREKFIDNKSELEAEKNYFKNALQYSEEQATTLQQEIDFKNKELEKFAFSLIEKEEILKKLKGILALVKNPNSKDNRKEVVVEVSNLIINNLNLSKEKISFYQNVDEINKDFYIRLSQQFNNLTDNDKRLIAFLKLGLTSKEISSIINISTKSVEMNRYRLRQKLNLLSDQNLLDFVNNI